MSRFLIHNLLALSIVCALGTNAVSAQEADRKRTAQSDVTSQIQNWPEASRKAAQMMVQKYGQPNEVTPTRLIWFKSGPWKQTIVYKEEVRHSFPMPHTDVLEQFVDYRVPPDKFDELAQYDGSVIAERTKGEISARCDKEEMNFLAINLAHDIVEGRRTVDDARAFYAKTAMATMKGEKSPYVQKLQFDKEMRTADADTPAAGMKEGAKDLVSGDVD